MWVCQKCQLKVTEAGKICRSCGGILDEVPSAESEASAEESVCPDCGERVTGTSDECWNCSTKSSWIEAVILALKQFFDQCWNFSAESSNERGADAAPRSGTGGESDQDAEALTVPVSEIDEQPSRVTNKCPRCGSTKIISDLTVMDQGDSSDGRLKTVVFGSPQALFFKDALYGVIEADICGACGHIELHVINPNQLYRHYQKSRGLDRSFGHRQHRAVQCQRCRMLITAGSASCPHCWATQGD